MDSTPKSLRLGRVLGLAAMTLASGPNSPSHTRMKDNFRRLFLGLVIGIGRRTATEYYSCSCWLSTCHLLSRRAQLVQGPGSSNQPTLYLIRLGVSSLAATIYNVLSDWIPRFASANTFQAGVRLRTPALRMISRC